MGRKKKEQQQESLKQNPVNETPEDGDSAEYEEMPDQSKQIMQTGSVTVTKAKHVIHCLTIVGRSRGTTSCPRRTRPPSMSTSSPSWSPSSKTPPSRG